MYNIAIVELARQVFGLVNSRIINPYRVGQQEAASPVQPYVVDEVPVEESDVASVTLGSPVMMPVTFVGGRYRERLPDGSINFVEYPDYVLPFASITEVTMPKVIVKTEIAGRSGTVKEYISDDDYQILFKGLIVGADYTKPPEDEIRAFRQICAVPQAIEVECELFEWLGIGLIVLETPSIFQLEGYTHVVGFQVGAISDELTEIRLRDDL